MGVAGGVAGMEEGIGFFRCTGGGSGRGIDAMCDSVSVLWEGGGRDCRRVCGGKRERKVFCVREKEVTVGVLCGMERGRGECGCPCPRWRRGRRE